MVGAARMFLTFTPRAMTKRPMERPMPTGKGALPKEPAKWHRRIRKGFTLIEMMIVMAIIVILISVAIPFYQKAIIRAKETVLHNNLFAMRSAIDEYSYDKQKAPQSLQDLVSGGYLHDVPKDPITQSRDSWKITMEDSAQAVDSSQ